MNLQIGDKVRIASGKWYSYGVIGTIVKMYPSYADMTFEINCDGNKFKMPYKIGAYPLKDLKKIGSNPKSIFYLPF